MYGNKFGNFENGGYIDYMEKHFKKLNEKILEDEITSQEDYYKAISSWPEDWEVAFWVYEIKNNKGMAEIVNMADTLARVLLDDDLVDFTEIAEQFKESCDGLKMTFSEFCSSYMAEKADHWLSSVVSDPDEDLLSNYVVMEKPWFWFHLLWATLLKLDVEYRFTTEIAQYLPNI